MCHNLIAQDAPPCTVPAGPYFCIHPLNLIQHYVRRIVNQTSRYTDKPMRPRRNLWDLCNLCAVALQDVRTGDSGDLAKFKLYEYRHPEAEAGEPTQTNRDS